jgi:hypothetical protein
LKYYTDENKIQKDLKGTIDLTDLILVEKKGKSEVHIIVADGGESLLKCKTPEIAEEWHSVLKNYIKEDTAPQVEQATESTKDPAPNFAAVEDPKNAADRSDKILVHQLISFFGRRTDHNNRNSKHNKVQPLTCFLL